MNSLKALVLIVVFILAGLWTMSVNAEVLNLSGTWKLNVDKSDFGNMPTPTVIVIIKIEHKEPNIKWSTPVFDQEGNKTSSDFTTVIDGKQRPYTEGPITKTQAFTRISPSAIEYVAKSTEGETIGTGTWTISKDRKVLTQKANTRDMNGQPLTVIQVFEKQ